MNFSKIHFGEVFESRSKYEKGRVLVISDAGDYPFVCSIHKFYERVAEGVKSEWRGDEYFCEPIGGGDTLFVFETTGRMLFFDHSEGVSLAIPNRLK